MNVEDPSQSNDNASGEKHTPTFISNYITLDVSGRKLRSSKATLEESPWFEALFARWQDSISLQADGSYFVDADSDVVEHLLGFMRRPNTYPVFWNKDTGFDYVLYNKLQAEADYFILHELRDWIREKKFEQAVTTRVTTKVKEMIPDKPGDKEVEITEEGPANMPGTRHVERHFLPSKKKRWNCPRGLEGHTQPDHCNSGEVPEDICLQAWDLDHGMEWPEEYRWTPSQGTLVITSYETEFNQNICIKQERTWATTGRKRKGSDSVTSI